MLDEPLHPFVMRALPIDLFAVWANLEFVEIQFGQRFETVEHSLLWDGLQRMVAAQAAMKRRDPFEEIETLDHFRQLLQGVEGARAVSVSDHFSHQKAPVAAEKDALIPLENFSQFLIIIIMAIKAIEPQHSQIGGQPSQMVIEQKARLDETSVLDGVDLHLVFIPSDRTERSLATIDLHPSDLRMRHPQRLNQVLERLFPAKLHTDDSFSLIARQEISQSPKKQEVSRSHNQIISGYFTMLSSSSELQTTCVITTECGTHALMRAYICKLQIYVWAFKVIEQIY